MSEYEIVGVQPDQVEACWPFFSEGLLMTKAKVTGAPTIDRLFAALKDQRMQAMVIIKDEIPIAGVVTEFVQDEDGPVLRVVILFGEDLNHWVDDLISVLDKYAQREGCRYIEFAGRLGWTKQLRGRFEQEAVIMRRQVNG